MKLRTRLFLWYGGALLAAMLVLLAHGAYEVYEHTHEKKPAFGSEFRPEDPTGDWHEVKEVIAVELLFGVPLLIVGIALTWWFTKGSLDKLQSLTDAAAGLHAIGDQPEPRQPHHMIDAHPAGMPHRGAQRVDEGHKAGAY